MAAADGVHVPTSPPIANRHASCLGRSGSSARTCKSSVFSHGCRTTFGALVTPLARTWPVAGQKGSTVWPCHRGCTHAADDAACPQVARTGQAGGWPGTGRPHLTPHGKTDTFSDVVGEFDQPLFSSVCGSTTVTTPALRLRCAVPVGHQVRVRWYELPASCSTRRMVLVPMRGNPDRRSVRCNVVSDHVAVPWCVGPVPAGRWPRSAACAGGIGGSATTAAADLQRRQAPPVEPARDRPPSFRSQAGLARRVEEDTRAGHGQQRAGATHLVDAFAPTPGNPLQRRPFRAAQSARWLTLWGRHPRLFRSSIQ